ncbi:MAG: hypothetical protein P8014_20370, partial [Acidihalobacter sp.]|uniref:hypothetical protein n=1 Tax=Acidihalobacter sp. TaxID=1872108 RepID=UPI00307DA366
AKAHHQGQDAEARQLQQSEVTRLKRELARLEEENAFLKKGLIAESCGWVRVRGVARSLGIKPS